MVTQRASRRLARAISSQSTPRSTPYRTGTVTAVDPTAGSVDLEITAEDGTTVAVPGVRFLGGMTPQVGRQVTYTMNGSEPVILGESGSEHDPVFDGRVVARSFYAIPGENLMPITSRRDPWDGWAGSGDTTTDESGRLVLTATSGLTEFLSSPLVPIGKTDRHYTVWVEMEDIGVNAKAYVVGQGFDAAGELVTQWGQYVDDVRVQPSPGETEAPPVIRYPMPDANEYLDPEITAVRILVFPTAEGEVSINNAYVGTAPVVEGGAVLLGRTQIDQAGIRLDGEDLLSPWSTTIYSTEEPDPLPANTTWIETDIDTLGGGSWVVRHRRMGRVVFFNAFGNIEGAMTGDGDPLDLPLPYTSASRSVFVGHMGKEGDRNWPVTGYIVAGEARVERLIGAWSGNQGYFGPNDPFTSWGGGALGGGGGTHYELHVSGVYEAD